MPNESKRKGAANHRQGKDLSEDTHTGLSPSTIARAIVDKLLYTQGKLPETATANDWYLALAKAVRDRLLERWISSFRTQIARNAKIVSYLSAEFLMGPQLGNNLLNLGILNEVRQAAEMVGLDLDSIIDQEEEPGLGNGGLGRLAACYLDSLATLEIPAIGYGIRYEFGIFDQEINDGWQREVTDKWLRYGNPWEIERAEISFEVPFGGYTEQLSDDKGQFRVRWIPERTVRGVAHDIPILGYGVNTTNILRLWKAEAGTFFDLTSFNLGDYFGAVSEKVRSENLSKVLYPNDVPIQGKRLRLEQQLFFVSCSLQDMLRMHLGAGSALRSLPESFAVQLNDTHPAIAVPELMRLLVDVHEMQWDEAWKITVACLGYTNHTLLPEALERWSLPLFGSIAPRHLEIVQEINRRFLSEVQLKLGEHDERISRLALIDESGEKAVRMAHVAFVGSHAVNGVAELHSSLMKREVFRDFVELFPERFFNVTNGVTPRRWIALSNPRLTDLITSAIGKDWLRNTETELLRLEPFESDSGFREEWRRVKHRNKRELAQLIQRVTRESVDPDSLFDIQVKRIHGYKRQLLNVFHVISLYLRLKQGGENGTRPRSVIFGGKAAPSYAMAKLIIRLINGVAEVVNSDRKTRERLKVIFYPDFTVKNGQHIYPAADLAEQISTAGKEASGTGNMKFAMNGALTIGTLDGANIEIRERVGAENFFLFGLTSDEVRDLKSRGYNPSDFYRASRELKEIIGLISSGFFSRGDRAMFQPILDSLMTQDEYMLFADYESYIACQQKVSLEFLDRETWTRKSILNVARTGYFTSDRSIREYCEKIWSAIPVKVKM
jgi:glycogen phosphorylase